MTTLIVCPACDLVHRGETAPATQRTRCSRCRAPLHRPQSAHLDTAIALAIAALLLFLLGNLYPVVTLHINGTTRSATLLQAALGLYRHGFPLLSTLVVLTTVVAPLVQLLCLLYLLLP